MMKKYNKQSNFNHVSCNLVFLRKQNSVKQHFLNALTFITPFNNRNENAKNYNNI